MKKDLLYDTILSAIKEKIPNRIILANTLAELLNIEKEAVYRRLRGEVAFSFVEIAAIASTLGISLDNIVGARYINSRPFQLKLVEYIDPVDIDYRMLEHYIYILNLGKDDPDSKVMDCTSILPQSLYLNYKTIARFFLFKWMYQCKDFDVILRFKDVRPTERLLKIQERNIAASRLIRQTFYVWDPLIFHYLVNDINYFISINLVEQEDLRLLKEELLLFLDDMEILAARGKYDETGNSLFFYISSINFDTSYRCIEVKQFRISLIRAFTLNAAASLDKKTYGRINNWIQAVLRSSTMISVSGAKQRIQFFEKQRVIINTL